MKGITGLFMLVWLTGWSVGVAFIQYTCVVGGISPLMIFMVTHGGAEYAVLWAVSSGLMKEAQSPSSPPEVLLSHEGVVARWPAGSTSVMALVLGLLVFVVAYTLLFGSLGLAVVAEWRDLGLLGWGQALLYTVIWISTLPNWVRGLGAQLVGDGEIVLTVDDDEVRASVTRRFTATEARLPLAGMALVESPDLLTLRVGADSIELPVKAEGSYDELVDMVRMMVERAVPVEKGGPVPESLERLRSLTE